MMNVRVQRLFRVQRLLPRVTRHFTSIQAPGTSIDSTPHPTAASTAKADGPLEGKTEGKSILGIGRDAFKASLKPGREETLESELESVEAASPGSESRGVSQAVNESLHSRPNKSEPLYPGLSDAYQAGSSLQPEFGALDKDDEKILPKWTQREIPILTRSWHGTRIVKLSNFWLRDYCRCPKCVNQDTMQRAFDTFSIPQDIMPLEVYTEKEGLRVKWPEEGNEDGHISIYPWEWIMKHSDDRSQQSTKSPYKLWGKDIESNPPSVHYDDIMAGDEGVARMLAKISEYGFSYVDDCPVSPEKTEELLQRIAFIRVTHYGGFYDFTADLTMKDTAYTNLALPAHTDNTYFTDPAGLQAFHLLSHTGGVGGESLLVDGFHAASILAKESKESYNALSQIPIPWHASGNEGITITPFKNFPVFEFGDLKQGCEPELVRVRWNNDDRGVVNCKENDGQTQVNWYKAAREWNSILKRKDMEYWAQLKPGRPLIFDNWRILHGRAAFTGKRRICGAYINRDDWMSRWRNTNFSREEALKQIL